jgi:DNA topoisomerase VI subunit B
MSAPRKLKRETFRATRVMDFFSQKELTAQTGHDVNDWPLVIAKELIDNALDACEDSDIPPDIGVTADAAGITIRDNGPGLPEKTLAGAMDFTVRASSREAYVSPSRGAQGHGLKTLIAMPSVLDPAGGKFTVEAHGKRHVITCETNVVSQRPEVHDDVTRLPKCKNSHLRPGTRKQAFSGGPPYEFNGRREQTAWVLSGRSATCAFPWTRTGAC